MTALPAAIPDKLRSVQALLGSRQLDRTLTSVAPAVPREVAPFPSESLSAQLGGGIPRGQISEVVGPASSGRTGLAWAALAAATARGEWAALVDTFDRFDPERAAHTGLVLPRLLWVRGQALSKTAGAIDPAWVPGERAVRGPGTMLERTVDRAIKALNLIVQSGVCTFVVLDFIDVPSTALTRVPRSTWLRIHRIIEGSETAVVLLASAPVARSAGGVSIVTGVGRGERAVGRGENAVGRRARVIGGTAACGIRKGAGPGSVLPHLDGVDPLPGSALTTPDSRLRRGSGGQAQLPTPDDGLPPPPDTVFWKGTHDRSRRLGGLKTRLRATSPRGFVGAVSLRVG